jgi:hypothetical protein
VLFCLGRIAQNAKDKRTQNSSQIGSRKDQWPRNEVFGEISVSQEIRLESILAMTMLITIFLGVC